MLILLAVFLGYVVLGLITAVINDLLGKYEAYEREFNFVMCIIGWPVVALYYFGVIVIGTPLIYIGGLIEKFVKLILKTLDSIKNRR